MEEEEENLETLSVRNFLAARIQEINSLSHQISMTGTPATKGLAFQHVPKHMRRRAVSHNPKRLPKRLQTIHKSQVEKSSGAVVKKPKKPSRRHRRRPSNLLLEYNRRQRDNKWMETHIWHAKRYHMCNMWGYKLPFAPTDKGYRACYRAARDHCVMRDVSFYTCFQLEGPFELLANIAAFAPSDANPFSPCAEMYKGGKREGKFFFYKGNCYPQGYVGNIRFHWKSDNSAIFLWVHPAHKEEILQELCCEFELIKKLNLPKKLEDEPMEHDSSESPHDDVINAERVKLCPKKLEERPKWINYSTNVTLTDLEGVINRFRFYGPLSTDTLKEVLQCLTRDKLENENVEARRVWWRNYYNGEEKKILIEKQATLWNNLKHIHQVPCNSILPLTVNDPRILLPQSRGPLKSRSSSPNAEIFCDGQWEQLLEEYQNIARDSPLWNEDIRMSLVNEKMSQQEFDRRRSQLLIPGSKLQLGVEENQVPILLINRSSVTEGLKEVGWDFVLPAGWAMSFWVAFVYRAVRTIGLRDSQHFDFETIGSTLSCVEDAFFPPDSHAGNTQAKKDSSELRSQYFKYTPAKRPNLIKLGCPFPFQIQWELLLERFNKNSPLEKFFVLRDSSIIEKLQSLIHHSKTKFKEDEQFNFELSKNNCLVAVRLTIFGKGTIEAGAVICIPQESDLKLSSVIERDCNIIEPSHDDTTSKSARQSLMSTKCRLKSFLKKKRKQSRKVLKQGKDEQQSDYSSSHLQIFQDKIQDAWLPDSKHELSSMSRTPIGFIVFGHETYSIGKCSGIGYCALRGIEQWLMQSVNCDGKGKKRLILVRNCRDSYIYRFATLELSY